jgi:PKD repeat protein
LNELALNIMRNTAVSGLAFTANSTAGGAPFAITLSTGFDGNANSFVIDWGDGSALETTSDSTPSHTYT